MQCGRWVQVVLAALAMVATLPGRTHGLGLITVPLLRDLHLDETYYANLNLPSTSDKALNTCQKAIGKSAAKFFAAKSKALQKCWDARLKGKHSNPCPSPGDGPSRSHRQHPGGRPLAGRASPGGGGWRTARCGGRGSGRCCTRPADPPALRLHLRPVRRHAQPARPARADHPLHIRRLPSRAVAHLAGRRDRVQPVRPLRPCRAVRRRRRAPAPANRSDRRPGFRAAVSP